MFTETDKQAALADEKFIAEILKIRRRPAEEKKWWEAPHITSALTAVLTVAVTTFATYYMQARLKTRDYELARQDLRLNQARDAMVTVYDLMATLLKGTEDRTKVASGQYDALSDTVLSGIVDETNKIDARWRRERETTEAALYLYFGDDQNTMAKWLTTRTHMQAYADCAERIYVQSQAKRAPRDACTRERLAADSAFAALRDALIVMYRTKLGASLSTRS